MNSLCTTWVERCICCSARWRLLLAIGCGNVSILLLARGTSRQHEFAVRTAIGASRGRIIRQLLTESLLLSLTGAALGVLLAYRALALIVELLPKYSFPHEAAIQINLPVLAFSVGDRTAHGDSVWPVACAAAFAARGEPGDAVEHAQDCRRCARTDVRTTS